MWRYQRGVVAEFDNVDAPATPRADLWDALERNAAPLLLCRGMLAQSVVDDADVAELLRRRADAEVVEFPNAGHSIQGDMPLELAETIRRFAL